MGKTRAVKYNTVSRKKRLMDDNAPLEISGPLAFDMSGLSDDNEYYWERNNPVALSKLESRDWKAVTEMPDVEVGDDKTVSVGTTITVPDGSGGTMILMFKPKKWCDDDRKNKDRRLQKIEDAMKIKNETEFIKKE